MGRRRWREGVGEKRKWWFYWRDREIWMGEGFWRGRTCLVDCLYDMWSFWFFWVKNVRWTWWRFYWSWFEVCLNEIRENMEWRLEFRYEHKSSFDENFQEFFILLHIFGYQFYADFLIKLKKLIIKNWLYIFLTIIYYYKHWFS